MPTPHALGHDLASVACQAAIELDNLILGRTHSLSGVAELAGRLTEEVPLLSDLNSSLSRVDLSTVMALHGALQGPCDEIADLCRRVGEIVRRLKTATADPQAARASDPGGLHNMKQFCLTLSRWAAAVKRQPW